MKKVGGLKHGRGPVAGSGKPLSDSEALKILDEVPEPEAPDIGVVINPESDPAPGAGQQTLVPQREPLDFTSWVEQRPGHYSVIKHLPSGTEPKVVLSARSLDTPIVALIDPLSGIYGDRYSHGFWDKPVVIQLMIEDQEFNVRCPRDLVERPGATLWDLLRQKTW